MNGWHFLPADRKLRWGTREYVIPGKAYTATGDIKICNNGMHASETIWDALHNAPGPVLCRVNVTGELQHHDDKFVGRSRHVLWMIDAEKLLHEFACRCAEDGLRAAKVDNKECWAAIYAKRKWLRGEISDQELAAAWDTARAAARYTARDVAWAAAWAAARDAAWDAARGAERAWQSTELERMVRAEYRRTP